MSTGGAQVRVLNSPSSQKRGKASLKSRLNSFCMLASSRKGSHLTIAIAVYLLEATHLIPYFVCIIKYACMIVKYFFTFFFNNLHCDAVIVRYTLCAVSQILLSP